MSLTLSPSPPRTAVTRRPITVIGLPPRRGAERDRDLFGGDQRRRRRLSAVFAVGARGRVAYDEATQNEAPEPAAPLRDRHRPPQPRADAARRQVRDDAADHERIEQQEHDDRRTGEPASLGRRVQQGRPTHRAGRRTSPIRWPLDAHPTSTDAGRSRKLPQTQGRCAKRRARGRASLAARAGRVDAGTEDAAGATPSIRAHQRRDEHEPRDDQRRARRDARRAASLPHRRARRRRGAPSRAIVASAIPRPRRGSGIAWCASRSGADTTPPPRSTTGARSLRWPIPPRRTTTSLCCCRGRRRWTRRWITIWHAIALGMRHAFAVRQPGLRAAATWGGLGRAPTRISRARWRLDDTLAHAHGNLVVTLALQGEIAAAVAHGRRAVARCSHDRGPGALQFALLRLAYSDDVDVEELAAQHRACSAAGARRPTSRPTSVPARTPIVRCASA